MPGNTICLDDGGRYSYENQPSVCKWNLKKLGEALSSNLSEEHLSKGLEMLDYYYFELYILHSIDMIPSIKTHTYHK